MRKIIIINIIISIFIPFYIHAVNTKYDISTLTPQKSPSGKWGYLDDNGYFRIKPQFELALPFKEGLAAVSVFKKFGYIDGYGKPVINPQFDDARNFSDGLAAVMIFDQKMNKKWGYIDKTGQFIIAAKFDAASDFTNGSAEVSVEEKNFLIDKSGTVINDKAVNQL
jgi:hypothetical protein